MFPGIIAGISALAGGLLNRPTTTQQNGSATTNTSQEVNANQNASTAPQYDPLQLAMRNFLIGNYFNRMQQGTGGVVNSYIGQGVNNINNSANSSEQAIKNMLAARGMSYSPAAATPLANAESARIGQVTDLRNQAPLLNDQLQRQRLTDFSSYLSGLPVGSTTSGTSYQNTQGSQHTDQTGQVTAPGNILGGSVNSLGNSLALMYGLGAFNGGNKGPGNMNTSGGGGMN